MSATLCDCELLISESRDNILDEGQIFVCKIVGLRNQFPHCRLSVRADVSILARHQILYRNAQCLCDFERILRAWRVAALSKIMVYGVKTYSCSGSEFF